MRSRATDTRTCTGVRSGRRRCLIGWSRSGPRSDCQPDREHPGRWLGLSPARSPARGEFLVASDREDTLKKAEKLLRQGRLEPAIAEYLRVVEAEPGDWITANTLGDLYVRAGQADKAAAQYSRIAEHFFTE